MNYFLAILAGAIQGLSEFLPISSTGHLIIFENIFGISQTDFGLAFDASLHLGTLIAIIIFFYKDYLNIFKNNLYIKLAVGTVPAVFFGLIFENHIDSTLRQTSIVAMALIIFSSVLVLAEKIGKQNKSSHNIGFQNALVVGFFQALALIPGISRSGSTISAGLFLGLSREQSARFAFLLSGPIVALAGAKKFFDVLSQGTSNSHVDFFLIGIVSSTLFGYLTIKYFLKYLSTKTLYPFVIYRIIIGILLL